jgi:GntR family transcriptional regulator
MTDPRYLDLADELERDLRDRPAGSRLPSENDLARIHEVNRQTARAALQQLESRHLVLRLKGRGTFVIRRLPYVISSGHVPSFTDTVARSGATATSQLIRLGRRPATTDEAHDLAISPNADVIAIVRRGKADGLPASRSTSVLPAERFEDLSEHIQDDTSLFAVLRNAYGAVPTRRSVVARLEVAPHEVATALGLERRPPCWRVISTNVDRRTGVPIERSDTWMRPDLFDVVLQLDDPRTP